MSKLVKFESVEGVQVAINPSAVTMISSLDVPDIVYIQTSNGEETVKSSFEEALAKLSEEAPKKTILREEKEI